MQEDEQAIRELIATWERATAAGDLPSVLSLMAEDVVFLLPDQPPMRGREPFAQMFRAALEQSHIEAKSDIQEIQVCGEWAYCVNRLSVTVTPLQGEATRHLSGYTLTILRKSPEGKWQLTRDANLLSEETPSR